jgi:hypothetical protein
MAAAGRRVAAAPCGSDTDVEKSLQKSLQKSLGKKALNRRRALKTNSRVERCSAPHRLT